MRRRSFWKLPVAALAAVVLPKVAPTAAPLPALSASLPVSEDELGDGDGTMSGYAIEQMRLAALLDWTRDSPQYRRYLDQKIMQHLGYADFIDRPAPYDITLNGVGYMLSRSSLDALDAHTQAVKDVIGKRMSPQWRYANDGWSPVKPDDLADVVHVDFGYDDAPRSLAAEDDV